MAKEQTKGKPFMRCKTATTSPKKMIGESAFKATAGAFWDEDGPYRLLHRITPFRLFWLFSTLCNSGIAKSTHNTATSANPAQKLPKSLKGLRILDVGCGGGLVCEPLALKGANVVGIDTTQEAIDAAQQHARLQCEKAAKTLNVTYQHTDLKTFASHKANQHAFDVVVAFEVIEHNTTPLAFFQDVKRLLKPRGLFALSTPNRTLTSYLTVLLGAEMMGWIPKGTHLWSAFLTPQELKAIAVFCNFKTVDAQGLSFDWTQQRWSLTKDLSINYFMSFLNKS